MDAYRKKVNGHGKTPENMNKADMAHLAITKPILSQSCNKADMAHLAITKPILSRIIQDGENITYRKLQLLDDACVVRETEIKNSPKNKTEQLLNNSLVMDEESNGYKVTATHEVDFNPQTTEGISGFCKSEQGLNSCISQHLDQQPLQHLKEGSVCRPEKTNRFKPSKLCGEVSENKESCSKPQKFTDLVCSSPLRQEMEPGGTTIFDFSTPLVKGDFVERLLEKEIVESPLEDDDVFLVSSLRDRLEKQMYKQKLSNVLLIESNMEAFKHCAVEESGSKTELKSCSGKFKNKTSVSNEEEKPFNKPEEKENIAKLVQEQTVSIVSIQNPIEQLNMVKKKNKTKKKTIPKSQRKGYVDSPKEVSEAQRKHGKSIENKKYVKNEIQVGFGSLVTARRY